MTGRQESLGLLLFVGDSKGDRDGANRRGCVFILFTRDKPGKDKNTNHHGQKLMLLSN